MTQVADFFTDNLRHVSVVYQIADDIYRRITILYSIIASLPIYLRIPIIEH